MSESVLAQRSAEPTNKPTPVIEELAAHTKAQDHISERLTGMAFEAGLRGGQMASKFRLTTAASTCAGYRRFPSTSSMTTSTPCQWSYIPCSSNP